MSLEKDVQRQQSHSPKFSLSLRFMWNQIWNMWELPTVQRPSNTEQLVSVSDRSFQACCFLSTLLCFQHQQLAQPHAALRGTGLPRLAHQMLPTFKRKRQSFCHPFRSCVTLKSVFIISIKILFFCLPWSAHHSSCPSRRAFSSLFTLCHSCSSFTATLRLLCRLPTTCVIVTLYSWSHLCV